MSKIVITTVGTSLLEKKDLATVKGWLSKKMKKDIDDLFAGTSPGQEAKDKTVSEYFKTLDTSSIDNAELEDYSAEISSLKMMLNLKYLNKDNDRVKLLFSDTPDCTFCARANALYIKKHLAKCDYEHDVIKIDGLEVKEAHTFLNGLENLISQLEKIKEDAKEKNFDIVFNITGGYKGVIPFISFFARKHKLSLYYLYQDSDLIEIPPAMIITSTDSTGKQTKKDLGPL